MTFIENLTKKLDYAKEATLITLPAATAVEVTTTNTVTTVASYTGPTLKSADVVEFAYLATIDNQSANNEAFSVALDYGNSTVSQSFTVNTTVTADITVTARIVNLGANSVLHVIITDGTTTKDTTYFLDEGDFTTFTVNIENASVVASGCDVSGKGGYVMIDNVTTA